MTIIKLGSLYNYHKKSLVYYTKMNLMKKFYDLKKKKNFNNKSVYKTASD